MRNITHHTMSYGDKQILEITVPAIAPGTGELDLVSVEFTDTARNIRGTVRMLARWATDCSNFTLGDMVATLYAHGAYDTK